MPEGSGIDWDAVERQQRRPERRYSSHTCPICSRVIKEGAWGSRDSNFKKHMAAHERRGES